MKEYEIYYSIKSRLIHTLNIYTLGFIIIFIKMQKKLQTVEKIKKKKHLSFCKIHFVKPVNSAFKFKRVRKIQFVYEIVYYSVNFRRKVEPSEEPVTDIR